ncbi:MAG: type IX secretion system membrane protein PorP/SprF, partial [Bacteroidales bacterium]|nr:type IX secretion system membrane protein PorP/SprF [Bacteroidales bacterium]
MKKYPYIFLFVFLNIINVYSQDIHFSKFSSAPLLLNPALTGNFSCNLRAGLNYRKQAESITVPFETYSAFIDGKFMPKNNKRSWWGMGGVF